jgi:NAD(P)H-dependent FMN reductase
MLKIGIVIGSTRPGRKAEAVAAWVYEHAQKRTDASFEIVDLVEYALPLLDEPKPASSGVYTKDHTKKWAAKVDALDAFVFVTPEYNHSTSAALKNAIDFLQREWHDKAVGFVSYGASANGARAVEHLRSIVGEMKLADVRSHVALSTRQDFENNLPKPDPRHETTLGALFDQLVAWGGALAALRKK